MAVQLWFAASHEQFPPSDLLAQAREAADAGFQGLAASDHFQPWFPDGHSGFAWTWLGAVGQAVADLPLGTSVTPTAARYHPALIAQAFMTLEEMFPGRAYLGIGSGEALNEVPFGDDWPSPKDQIARMEEALQLIHRLWDGETVDHDGRFYKTVGAYLHTRAKRKPPIYVSAFGPQAAQISGRYGDGLWTLGDPDAAPEIIEAHREAAREAGRGDGGEVMLQVPFAWAEDQEAVVEGSKQWKATQVDDVYREDIHTVAEMFQRGVDEVSDEEFVAGALVSADPQDHVDRLLELAELGATVLCLQNIGTADPHGTIRTYGEKVIPAVREKLGG